MKKLDDNEQYAFWFDYFESRLFDRKTPEITKVDYSIFYLEALFDAIKLVSNVDKAISYLFKDGGKIKELENCFRLNEKNINNLDKNIYNRFNSAIKHFSSGAVNRKIKVVWEGCFFGYDSLSNCNRNFVKHCYDSNVNYELFIEPLDEKPFSEKITDLNHLIKDINNNEKDIIIRHYWPHNFSNDGISKLVLITPWEFGSVPMEWYDNQDKVEEFWVPSNYVKDCLINSGIKKEKIHTIPNGFDHYIYGPNKAKYQFRTKKRFKFLFVGGLIHRKGIDLLLKSYCELFNKSDDVCLVVKHFGSNDIYKNNYLDLILQYQQDTNCPEIELIDSDLSDNEMASLYRACDILVHPYRGEGFGLPMLEFVMYL